MDENERQEEAKPVEPGEEPEAQAEAAAGEAETQPEAEGEPTLPSEADPAAPGRMPPSAASPPADARSEEAAGGDSAPPGEERPATAASDLPPGAELEPIAIEPERELDAEERARLEAEAEERARREAEATAERIPEPEIRREPRVSLDSGRRIQATGKRKSSVARVMLRAGGGDFKVNDRSLDAYFPRAHLQTVARQPLVVSGYEETVDVRVRVHGGGVSGQADAIRHGIARALAGVDPELRGELKRRGLLTRDARIKERRKAGLKKARKRPQFSKR
jgi:small subunit ribosomal protein S9